MASGKGKMFILKDLLFKQKSWTTATHLLSLLSILLGCQQVSELFDYFISKDWKHIKENMLQSLNIDMKCLYFVKTLPKEMQCKVLLFCCPTVFHMSTK